MKSCLSFRVRAMTCMLVLFVSALILLTQASVHYSAAAQARPQQSLQSLFFTLDPTFGQAGILRSADTSPLRLYGASMLLRDGKVLLAARQDNAFVLQQYLPDGSLDSAFGATGVVTTTIGENATIGAMASTPDGAIIVVGAIGYPSAETPPVDTVHRFIARYTPAGQLDPTFGSNGVTIATDTALAQALYIQPDGKMIVAGTSSGTQVRFWLARYQADGTLDPSFGNAGVAESQFGGQFTQVGVQPNGQIVAVGYVEGCGAFACDADLVMAHYSDQGVLDSTFGDNGFVFDSRGTLKNPYPVGLVVDAEGKLIVSIASSVYINVELSDNLKTQSDLTLLRYTANGQPDSSFGNNGIAQSGFSGFETSRALAALDDGSYVVAGIIETSSLWNTNDVVLAHFSSSGVLEAAGISSIKGYASNPSLIVPQSDGNMVVIGTSTSDTSPVMYQLFQARYVVTPATQRLLLPLVQQ